MDAVISVEITWPIRSYTTICANESFFYPLSIVVPIIKTPIEEDSNATIGVTINATLASNISGNACK
jgi:hypothetical protein